MPQAQGDWVDVKPQASQGDWVDVQAAPTMSPAVDKPQQKFPITPNAGESFADTMKRGVSAGKNLTPAEITGLNDRAKKEGPGILAGTAAMAVPGMEGLGARILATGIGAGAGSVAGQAMSGQGVSPKKTTVDALEYGVAPEAIGGVLIKAGEQLAPQAIKALATKLFRGRMDVAGKAIDEYLSQPALAKIKVDVATPINEFLDKEIERANRVGAKSLANRISELKVDWNKSYNLSSPTLPEANAFKREVSKYTSYAGEANKVALNKIQKQATGITADIIEKHAPGIKPLNDAYANLAGGAKAARSSARKATSGFTGLGLAGLSGGLKGTGELTPDTIRAIMSSYGGQIPAVPSN